MSGSVPPEIESWFADRGWRVRRHQADMLAASDAGRHALLVADTGAGKTLAGFLPTLADFTPSRLAGAEPADGIHTLYVSPLKALAVDIAGAGFLARGDGHGQSQRDTPTNELHDASQPTSQMIGVQAALCPGWPIPQACRRGTGG